MDIVHTDSVFRVEPGTTPNYNKGSSLVALMNILESTELACDREWYLRDHLQYLFPYEYLELYGPQAGDANILDPTQQDNKTDFQKQNVKSFRTSSTYVIRGWVTTGEWTGPFVRLSYQAGPESPLGDRERRSSGTVNQGMGEDRQPAGPHLYRAVQQHLCAVRS